MKPLLLVLTRSQPTWRGGIYDVLSFEYAVLVYKKDGIKKEILGEWQSGDQEGLRKAILKATEITGEEPEVI